LSVDLMPPSSGLRKQLAEAHLHMQVQNIGVGPALWGIFLLGGDFVALTQQEAKEKIIVALDVPNREQALQLVEQLYDEVGAFKIGMQLYNAEGPSIVKEIQRLGGKVFIDLKLHDIPNTVAEATKVLTNLQAFIMTLHAGGGKKMLAAAAKAAAESVPENGCKPLVVAVTVLTSLSQQEFTEEIGVERSIAEQVVIWAKMAKEAGLAGVVASPQEIEVIRQACGPDFVIITPGIRPLWAAANDQSRIMTPKQAVQAGANYLVIGRPITADKEPKAAARRIVEEIMEVQI